MTGEEHEYTTLGFTYDIRRHFLLYIRHTIVTGGVKIDTGDMLITPLRVV